MAHVVTCLEEGMPELKGEFGIEITKVWKGIGAIAALHVNVASKYNHEAVPVPYKKSRSERNASQDHHQQHRYSHDHHTQNHSHDHSHSGRAEMGGNNKTMTSRFRTVERFWEKDIEVIDGLLKSGFADGALCSTKFNIKDQEITIEHNPQQLSADFLQGFFADVGVEVTIISMAMSASLPATDLTHDVTPVVITQQSVDDEDDSDDDHGYSHSHSHSSIMTSVFKSASPYQQKDIETIEGVVKAEGGESIHSLNFNLTTQEITIEHDPQQHSTHDVGTFIAKAGFGVLIISIGMSASLPAAKSPEVSPTKTTSVHDFTPTVTTQQSQDVNDAEDNGQPHSHSHDHTGSGGQNHSHDHGSSSSSSMPSFSKLRNLPEIKRMLELAPDRFLAPWVKTNAIAAFTELAKAEAHTHGAASMDAVHFHEVGAVDSIV